MNYFKHLLYYLVLFALSISVYGQDTVFVKSLTIKDVSNITTDGKNLFVRVNNTLLRYNTNKDNFKKESNCKLKYSWLVYDKSMGSYVITNTKYIPADQGIDCGNFEKLLPGVCNKTATLAKVDDLLYFAVNGKVLQYRIDDNYEVFHKNKSIRHIYLENGNRVISTYSGIYVDSLFNEFSKIPIGRSNFYSNGEFLKLGEHYYLCQDNLLEYNPLKADFKTILKTENGPRLRKLIEYKSYIYAMYDSALGILSLDDSTQNRILRNDSFTDIIKFKDKLFACSSTGKIYEILSENDINIYTSNKEFNDFSISNDRLFLSANDGIYEFDKNYKLNNYIIDVEAIQSLFIEDKVVFTNNNGLYVGKKGFYKRVVNDIEFNKMALNMDANYLYAGSVNGLYVIKRSRLNEVILLNMKTNNVIRTDNSTLIYVIIFASCLFLVSALFLIKKTRQNKDFKREKLTSNKIRDLIYEKPQIKSVQNLSDFLKISSVQINRDLKGENITALKLMKSVKKEISKEMFENGKSVEEISKRVGYSMRYVKENFLNQK